jgi:hypothetical protein
MAVFDKKYTRRMMQNAIGMMQNAIGNDAK